MGPSDSIDSASLKSVGLGGPIPAPDNSSSSSNTVPISQNIGNEPVGITVVIKVTRKIIQSLCNRYAARQFKVRAFGLGGTVLSAAAVLAGLIGIAIKEAKHQVIAPLLYAGGAGVLVIIIIALLAYTRRGHNILYR